MEKCSVCGIEFDLLGDYSSELAAQADALGMESLTEQEQMLVNGLMCEDCYLDV